MKSIANFAALAAIGLTASFASVSSAEAQQLRCNPTQIEVQILETQYGQVRQNSGQGSDGYTYTQYANPETGTWTYLMSPQDGLSCRVGTGFAFEDFNTAAAANDAGRIPQNMGIGAGTLFVTFGNEVTGEWLVGAYEPDGSERLVFFGDQFKDNGKDTPSITAPTPTPNP